MTDRIVPHRLQTNLDDDADRERVLVKIRKRMQSEEAANSWYENYVIPGYGGKTAAELVNRGHVGWVLEFIDAVDAGIYA